MNLSKLLVSVNIAATLPIAVQVAAQASEQAAATEANSFKETINALSAQPKTNSTQVAVARKNFNLVKASPSALEVNGVKLRAFMPGRKLPSSKDFQLVSQRAQMAPERQSSLNGGVSESYAAASAYGSQGMTNSAYTSAAPRVVLDQVQAVARSYRTAKKKNQQAISPTSIAPASASASMQNSVADFGQFSKDVPASWMANDKNLSVIQAPSASPKEMAQIDRMIDRARPADAGTAGTAGPPPFPLSLLPQQSLKQFVGAKPQNRIAAPQAFFGSWHGNNQPKIASNLAPGGFRTNMNGGHFGSYAAPHAGHHANAIKSSNKMMIAQAHHNVAPAAKIAAYAPYNTTATY